MPNICNFDIHIKGKKKDILTLFDWLRADYRYSTDEFDKEKGEFKPLDKPECFILEGETRREVAHHIGYRVFDCYLSDDPGDFPDDEDICIAGWGNCAWSVYCCMFEGVSTYYSEEEDRKGRVSITLPNACKELSLETEIFSSEPGMSFAEHFHIAKDGTVLKDECADYSEIYIEDFDTYEEYEKDAKENYGINPVISKDRFNKAKGEGECSVILCDWVKEDEFWPFSVV